MPTQSGPTIPPALSLLRRIAAYGAGGLAHRALVDDGLPAHVATRLLDALRSRGYVRFNAASGHWVATGAGLQRVERAGRAAGSSPPA